MANNPSNICLVKPCRSQYIGETFFTQMTEGDDDDDMVWSHPATLYLCVD